MGAKCVPESNTYDQVMQINAVKCSAEVSLSETPTPNGIADSPPASESKGKLPAAESPVTEAETYTPKSNGGPVVASATDETRNLPDIALPCVKSNGGPAVASATAETRSLPGKTSNHSRKPSIGTTSLKANGSAKNGDSLSRSTSTMSSGSIASNISQLCEKYFMQPLIRSRSFPSDMPHNENSSSSRSMPYLHLRRRKGKCLRQFCMRFLPPAAACSGRLAYGFNRVADQNLGKSQPGDGTKPVFPFGFSKGNSGLETQGIQPSREAVSTTKLQKLRDTVREEALDKPPFNFFICHTEEDYVPYVDKLVKKCEKEGVSIFSRSYSLLWGDSQRIDTQLAISSALFGIVLLSPALLESYRSSWCEKV